MCWRDDAGDPAQIAIFDCNIACQFGRGATTAENKPICGAFARSADSPDDRRLPRDAAVTRAPRRRDGAE
jgi:hypothetical protein